MGGETLMKNLVFSLLIISAIFSLLQAQEPDDDPLSDSYIIQAGGGDEIIVNQTGEVAVYKYFEELTLFDRDTLVKTLHYQPSGGIEDICVDDFDVDEMSEIAIAIESGGQPAWALLKADASLLSIDSLAVWERIEEGTVTGPAIKSYGWGVVSPVLITSAQLDGDPQKEFVLAYWADDKTELGSVCIVAYDVGDSLKVTELGQIMDQPVTVPPRINLCEDAD